jgi:hypothetical protein
MGVKSDGGRKQKTSVWAINLKGELVKPLTFKDGT